MKIDDAKLQFMVTHWPEIKLTYRRDQRWPIEYEFYHPESKELHPDDLCMIEISKDEYKKVEEAWKYYSSS